MNVFAVLLYPPTGRPRVIELPPLPKGMSHGCQTFKARAKADAALAKFLADNPEYNNWVDGEIRQIVMVDGIACPLHLL